MSVSLGLCSSVSMVPWMRCTPPTSASVAGGGRVVDIAGRRGAGDERVAVDAGDHRQPAAELVGAVPAQLALVALLERGLRPLPRSPTAAIACVELGDLLGVAVGERRGGGFDARRAGRRRRRPRCAPVPSSRAGRRRSARRRSTRSGSAASTRARSRSPPATPATSSARVGGTPSATRRAARTVGGDRRGTRCARTATRS